MAWIPLCLAMTPDRVDPRRDFLVLIQLSTPLPYSSGKTTSLISATASKPRPNLHPSPKRRSTDPTNALTLAVPSSTNSHLTLASQPPTRRVPTQALPLQGTRVPSLCLSVTMRRSSSHLESLHWRRPRFCCPVHESSPSRFCCSGRTRTVRGRIVCGASSRLLRQRRERQMRVLTSGPCRMINDAAGGVACLAEGLRERV
ncbi:hypothetical protein BJ546DRAFT_989851 [Cryomyces antarcticus]